MAKVSRGVRLLLAVNLFGLVLGAATLLAGVSLHSALAIALLPLIAYLVVGLIGFTVLIPDERNASPGRAAIAWVVIGFGTIGLWVYFGSLTAGLFAVASTYASLTLLVRWSLPQSVEAGGEDAGLLRDIEAFELSSETAEEIVNSYGGSMIERTKALSAETDARTIRFRLICAPVSLLKHPIDEIRSALTIALISAVSQRDRDLLLLGLVELAHYVPDREYQGGLSSPASGAAERLVSAARQREVELLNELRKRVSTEQLDPRQTEALFEEIDAMLSSLERSHRQSGS